MAVERIFPAPVCGEDSCAIVTAVNGNCITPVKLQKCLTYITTGEAEAGLVLTNQAAYVLTKSQKALGFIWLLASTGHKLELPVEAAANFILTASAEHVLQYPRAASANIELTGAVSAAIQVFKEASAEFELSGLSAHLLEVFKSASSFFVLNAAVSGALTIDAEAAGIITLEAGSLFTATPKIEVDDFAITLDAEVAALTLSGLFAQASSGITLSAGAVASLVLHIDGVAEGNIVLNAEAVGSTATNIEGQAVANLVLTAEANLSDPQFFTTIGAPISSYNPGDLDDVIGFVNGYLIALDGALMISHSVASNGAIAEVVSQHYVLLTLQALSFEQYFIYDDKLYQLGLISASNTWKVYRYEVNGAGAFSLTGNITGNIGGGLKSYAGIHNGILSYFMTSGNYIEYNLATMTYIGSNPSVTLYTSRVDQFRYQPSTETIVSDTDVEALTGAGFSPNLFKTNSHLIASYGPTVIDINGAGAMSGANVTTPDLGFKVAVLEKFVATYVSSGAKLGFFEVDGANALNLLSFTTPGSTKILIYDDTNHFILELTVDGNINVYPLS